MTRMITLFALALALSTPAVAKKTKCPEAGSSAPLAQVMNEAFAADYEGCDVVTTAEFFATGIGTWVLPFKTKGQVVFRVLPPGVEGQKNPLSGEVQAMFVAVDKADSALLFELAAGDRLTLRGGTVVSVANAGGSTFTSVMFVATSVARAD